MRKLIPLALLAVVTTALPMLHAEPATPASTQPATQPAVVMETHTLVLLVLTDNPPKLEPEAAAELQRNHLGHIKAMARTGKLLIAGPFSARDDEKLRGVLIFNCSIDEARAMASEDPAVKAGRLKAVCQTWHTQKGIMEFHEIPAESLK